MKALRAADEFEALKERISSLDPDASAEGLSVLEIARQFHAAGFIISFEPKIKVTQRSGEKSTMLVTPLFIFLLKLFLHI
jgi:hypothetical protein